MIRKVFVDGVPHWLDDSDGLMLPVMAGGQDIPNWMRGLISGGTSGPTEVGFPSLDNNGDGAGVTAVDLGYGLVGILDADGNLVAVRSAAEGGAGGYAPQWRPGEQAMQQRQLDQFDRQLDVQIRQDQADLAEKRRQFDISAGLERERIAADIKMLEMRLKNNMSIAQLDSRTRLQIAGIEQQTALRGQDISREQFAAGLQARRAEFGATNLGQDAVRQAIFMLGGAGGTTPLELAAEQWPQMEVPEVRSLAKGGTVNLKDRPVAIRVGEGGRPEIMLVSKNKVEVIPEAASMQFGGTIGGPGVVESRRTMAGALRGAFEDRPLPRFGGLQPMEPVYGVQPRAPGEMAYDFFRKPAPVQRLILSALGVRGIDQEEALRRMRAATPAVAYGGIARSR